MSEVPISSLRLLRVKQVLDLIPFSPSRIRQLEAEGKFPKRVALGDSSVAWRESDIRQWLLDRIEQGKLTPHGSAGKAPAAKPKAPALARRRG